MCLYPRLIPNKKYLKNKKNGGIIPPVLDERVRAVPVGCGQCMECRKQKAREWQVRLSEDIKHNKNAKFVTLTLSNDSWKELAKAERNEGLEGYELENGIAKQAVRYFVERWRKKFKKSIRHWLVTELGQTGTEHLHIHGVIWTEETKETITERWGYGHVWIGDYVNQRTINYIVKYIHKTDPLHRAYKSVILTSAGIGNGYMNRTDWKNNKYKGTETVETYRTSNGKEVAMPKYWRNKIYTDEEKEKLWLQMLDKQKRYVDGLEIDISEGDQKYYEVLEIARGKNERLGYGKQLTWEQKRYEKERRILIQKKRIGK